MSIELAVEGLARLRDDYERFFSNPDDFTWAKRGRAQDELEATLQSEACASKINPLIATLVKESQATPAQAAPTLDDAENDVVEFERQLGLKMGFSEPLLRTFLRDARRTLHMAVKRKDELQPLAGTDALVEELRDLAARVAATYAASATEPRRRKSAHREDAKDYARRRLYVVGSVIADANYQHVFSYSYALSLGVSGVKGKRRKWVVIPTWSRQAA